MAKTGILSCINCLLLVIAPSIWGQSGDAGLEQLTVAEQYRQLNLILMISEGIDEKFIEQLQLSPATNESPEIDTQAFPGIVVDDFQSPLNRIVDQRELIDKAAVRFQYALDNEVEIKTTLEEMAAKRPEQVSQVDLVPLAEDAIIIRTALAGSIEHLAKNGDAAMAGYLATYQSRTLYLRNVMEFWKFDRELTAITNEAMNQTGGRMDAYQRLLEDEPDLRSFYRHLQSVEKVYRDSRGIKGKTPEQLGQEYLEEETNKP